MKLSSANGLIKVESELLDKLQSGDFERANVYIGYGCSDVVTLPISMSSPHIISSPPVTTYFSYPLSLAKNRDDSIVKITLKDIETGEIFSRDVLIDFAAYLSACPSGCTIESLNPVYTQLFEDEYAALLTDSDIDDTNFLLSISGDDILISGLPETIIPYSVEYSNSLVEYWLFKDSNKYILNGNLYLTPASLSLDEFIDGIYNVRIEYIKTDGSSSEEQNCFFIDITTKCLVAKYIKDMLSGEPTISKTVHTLHYALINGSNCGDCGCKNMCAVYNKLVQILTSSPPQNPIETNCGCQD